VIGNAVKVIRIVTGEETEDLPYSAKSAAAELGSRGLDLFADEDLMLQVGQRALISTGIAIELPVDQNAAQRASGLQSNGRSVRHLVEEQADAGTVEETQIAKPVELSQSKDVSVERFRPMGVCDRYL
jgi:dUTPase